MPKKSKKYVIALDDLDIGLLPTNYMTDNGKVAPLWTKTNLDLKNNNYYEFEIKTTESDKNETENIIENITCHICAIEVPKLFIKQHINSKKHEINLKIADLAMERVRKTFHHNNITNDNSIDSIDHFCASCVAVVKKSDKNSHEKSLLHRNSVIVDKFLHDFYLLYKNNDDDIVTAKCDNYDSDKISVNSKTAHDASFISEIANANVNFSHNDDSECAKNESSSYNDLNSTDTKDIVNETPKENEFLVVKTKKKRNRKVKLKDDEVKNLFDKRNTNEKVSVTRDNEQTKRSNNEEKLINFYPVFEDNKKNSSDYTNLCQNDGLFDENGVLNRHLEYKSIFLYCIVCKMTLHSDSDAVAHLNSFEHLNMYFDLLSEHCLRTNDETTHCEICGITFGKENELTHCEDMKHITKHEKHKKRLMKI